MNIEDREKLIESLKLFQNDLFNKSQNGKIFEWARSEAIDDSKIILQALIIIEKF